MADRITSRTSGLSNNTEKIQWKWNHKYARTCRSSLLVTNCTTRYHISSLTKSPALSISWSITSTYLQKQKLDIATTHQGREATDTRKECKVVCPLELLLYTKCSSTIQKYHINSKTMGCTHFWWTLDSIWRLLAAYGKIPHVCKEYMQDNGWALLLIV
jgi:hypothetical protein